MFSLTTQPVLIVNLNYLPPDGLRTGFVRFQFSDKISSENKIAKRNTLPSRKVNYIIVTRLF